MKTRIFLLYACILLYNPIVYVDENACQRVDDTIDMQLLLWLRNPASINDFQPFPLSVRRVVEFACLSIIKQSIYFKLLLFH